MWSVLTSGWPLSSAEEAKKSVSGMNESAIQAKYFELVRAEFSVRAGEKLMGGLAVRRTQAHGTRPCEGETEAGERQGCWYVSLRRIFSEEAVLECDYTP